MSNEILEKIGQLKYTLLNKPHERGEDDVYVTEIVSFYHPYKGFPFPDQLLRGHLYHHAIQDLLKDYCQSEVSLSKELLGKKIKGRVDLVCENTFIEIKSSQKTSFNQGALQLQIYNWLVGGGRKLILLYPTLTFDIIKPEPLDVIERLVTNYLKIRYFSPTKA
jgi:hypothetical protein